MKRETSETFLFTFVHCSACLAMAPRFAGVFPQNAIFMCAYLPGTCSTNILNHIFEISTARNRGIKRKARRIMTESMCTYCMEVSHVHKTRQRSTVLEVCFTSWEVTRVYLITSRNIKLGSKKRTKLLLN